MTLGAGRDVFGFDISLRLGSSLCDRACSWCFEFCAFLVAAVDVLPSPSSSSFSNESSFFALIFLFFGRGSVSVEGVKALYFAN
jgi:hypothetical protein